MLDKELVTIEREQFAELITALTAISNGLWAINDQLKPVDNAISNAAQEITKWQGIEVESLNAGFESVAAAIANLQPLPQPQPHPLEVRFMFIVKDDNPDVGFAVKLGDVTDAEGNPIPDAAVDVAVSTSDADVVAVTFDAAARTGSVHFGHPGVASIAATVSSGGTLLGTATTSASL